MRRHEHSVATFPASIRRRTRSRRGARRRPAMERSTLVLPEPDAPKSAVTPRGGARKTTSSAKSPSARRRRTARPLIACGGTPQENDEGEGEHPGGEPVRPAVVERLHVVVERDREHLGLARDIAADHQHHAELAHGVREAEHHGGDESRAGERHHHREESIPRRRRAAWLRLHRPLADALERGLQRLHHEGQRVDHRANHEAGEGEGQQAEGLGERSEWASRSHQHEQVEAEHRGRQHERQRHQRADRRFHPGASAREPPGDRRTDDEKEHGGGRRSELYREPHRGDVVTHSRRSE